MISSTSNINQTASTGFVSNPNAELKSDDFMKLFLTEMQYQDPTAPMETKDMLNQTSQMTQLKTNQDLSTNLTQLIQKMDMGTQFNSVSMIGKVADTGHNGFAVTDAKNLTSDIPFDLYFNEDYISANIKITNSNGEVVRTFNLEGDDAGVKNFTWDGKDDNGNPVSDGVYSVTADFKNKQLEEKTTQMGRYPISSVKFEGNEAYVKLGDNYLPLSSIKEVSES